jgi:DNA-binding GntR family transcriptional regulator
MKIITPIDQIVDHIRRAIFSGKFIPGSKLKEKEISEWIGVSRMPVREAFRILEAQGLIEIEPNKGAKVPVISLEDLEEIYEARVLLEVYCLRKFVSLISEQDLAVIEEICDKMEAALEKKDPLAYFDHSFDFHKYYISHCQNKLLESIFLRMENSIRCLQFRLDKKQEFYRNSLKEHRQILQALRAKDADRCEKLIRHHLESGYKSNKKIVSQLKSA